MQLRCLLLLLVAPPACETAAHYEQPPCQYDEIQGEVQGASGYVCAPKCEETTYNCPADVPSGATSQAQCMLQDADRSAFCALVCQADMQCPSGAKCQQIKQADIGVCLYPISFADWARQATTRKLAIGWPRGVGGTGVASFQIAKTYQALQALKQKYVIDDGDADMLTLKELLSSLTASTSGAVVPPGMLSAPGMPSLPGMMSVPGSALAGVPSIPGVAPPGSMVAPPAVAGPGSVGGSGGGSASGAWKHDVQLFEDDMSMGLVPGFSKMAKDTEWNIEHIQHENAASGLLRGLILWALAYVGVGSLIKYNSVGARGIDMIPHIGFWMEYPALVMDGVQYTKIIFEGLAGKSSSGSSSSGGGLDGGVRGRGGSGSFESFPA